MTSVLSHLYIWYFENKRRYNKTVTYFIISRVYSNKIITWIETFLWWRSFTAWMKKTGNSRRIACNEAQIRVQTIKRASLKSFNRGRGAALIGRGYIHIFMFYITDFFWKRKKFFCFYGIWTWIYNAPHCLFKVKFLTHKVFKSNKRTVHGFILVIFT